MIARILAGLMALLILLPGTAFGATRPGPAASPFRAKPKAAPVAKRSPSTQIVETELNGLNASVTDQLSGRVRLEGISRKLHWYSRVSGAFSSTTTPTSKRINKSTSSTLRLDTRFEWPEGTEYRYISHGMSLRTQKYNGKLTQPRSGYQLAATGVGRQIGKRFRGDIGLGYLSVYGTDGQHSPVAVASLQGQIPLTPLLSLNSDIVAMLPASEDATERLDSDIYLAYQMVPGLFLRLGWADTNLLRPDRLKSKWDSSIRLGISFRRTASH